MYPRSALAASLGIRLHNAAAVERFQFLRATDFQQTTPGTGYVIHETVYQLYNANQRPEVYLGLSVAADTLGTCSLTGEISDAPP